MRIWAVAESTPGGPTSTMLELVGGARRLGEEVDLFTWGPAGSVPAAAEVLGRCGVRRVYSVGDPSPGLPGPAVATAMARTIAIGDGPQVVLIGSGYDGRDVAGRLSAKLDRPLIANVTGLSPANDGSGELVAHHEVFGGRIWATSRFSGPGPAIFVVREHSFEPAKPDAEMVAAEVVAAEIGHLGRTGAAQVLGRHLEPQIGPKLDEASVVVSGGRGLGSPEGYRMIEELARLLGGAPGASRAIVDAGWVPYSHQVGQTGKTVVPKLYIACGISGATQHLVGMKGAAQVIAINTDPDAGIFASADLGIVGDCQIVLPRLIEALRARLGTGPKTS